MLVVLDHSCLKVHSTNVARVYGTFENNLRVQKKFINDMRESYDSISDQHFFFKYLLTNALLKNIT